MIRIYNPSQNRREASKTKNKIKNWPRKIPTSEEETPTSKFKSAATTTLQKGLLMKIIPIKLQNIPTPKNKQNDKELYVSTYAETNKSRYFLIALIRAVIWFRATNI